MAQVEPVDPFDGREQNLRFSLTMYWDTNTLEWVKGTQGSGGGGGGGDASAANQVTGNASLASIDSKIPALGQALAAASTPVVLTAAQEAALTPPAAITGFATSAKQDTAQASFGATNDAEATGDGSIIAILKRLRTLLSGTLTVAAHAVTNAGTFAVQLTPPTSGGLLTFMASGSDGSSILVATAQAIKATAGQMYGYYAYNPEAAVTFVHFYNTAAASVTVGTTSPQMTIAIPAGSAANLSIPQGIEFTNAGWSCAATTTAGGNTAPATGVSLVAWYK